MKKRIIIPIILLFIVCFFSIIGNIQRRDGDSELSENNLQQDYALIYKTLNKPILDNDSQNAFTDFKDDIYQFSELVKGKFVTKINEESIFPTKLVYKLEKALYNSCNYSPRNQLTKNINDSYYFKTIRSLDSENFESEYDAYEFITGSDSCIAMFYINMNPNEENYVLVYDSGGSYGANNIVLTRRINGEFEKICEFQTQNNGYGKVIQYEDDFYYVFMEYNYMLKIYDRIRMYKLGLNAASENIIIKYLPEKFIWKNIYNANTNYDSSLDDYVDSIKDTITSDEYLENGSGIGANVFYGDEEEATDFLLSDDANHYYKIDFANLGIPVYMTKSIFTPSDYRSTQHLRAKFYIYNYQDDSYVELENLELGKYLPLDIELEQMWFKKINNKVLTFRVYHISDYNYALNIALIEGDNVTQLRTDIFSPQRKFEIVEGDLYKEE